MLRTLERAAFAYCVIRALLALYRAARKASGPIALLKGAAKAIPNSDFKAHNRIVLLHD